MSDPVFSAKDYLNAETVVDHLVQNLAIQFQIEGETFDRDTMQRHVNERSALILTKKLLLDAGVRALKNEH